MPTEHTPGGDGLLGRHPSRRLVRVAGGHVASRDRRRAGTAPAVPIIETARGTVGVMLDTVPDSVTRGRGWSDRESGVGGAASRRRLDRAGRGDGAMRRAWSGRGRDRRRHVVGGDGRDVGGRCSSSPPRRGWSAEAATSRRP